MTQLCDLQHPHSSDTVLVRAQSQCCEACVCVCACATCVRVCVCSEPNRRGTTLALSGQYVHGRATGAAGRPGVPGGSLEPDVGQCDWPELCHAGEPGGPRWRFHVSAPLFVVCAMPRVNCTIQVDFFELLLMQRVGQGG